MSANNMQGNLSDDRQKEHQRQQERLKAMAATSDTAQVVSADRMIENLLKESFIKMPQTPLQVSQTDHSYLELPVWLQCESLSVPTQYKCLWSLVQSTVDLADTQKVSQLLLTSGLHLDLLGFIWNLANRAIPGQLTKQEFYIVLALVGLAQTGYTFNNLNILKLITVPSIPVLQVKYPMSQPYVLQNFGTGGIANQNGFSSLTLQPFESLNDNDKDKNHLTESATTDSVLFNDLEKSLFSTKESSKADSSSKTPKLYSGEQSKGVKNSNLPCIGSSPTAELENDFSAFQSVSGETIENHQNQFDSGDDFTEFQSANVDHLDPFETVVINQKREIPKIPLPKTFTGRFTNLKSNIRKISPETEKKLKVLLPNESLTSLPESKISSNNMVSTSISVLGSNQGIGSRLANHSFNAKLDRPKCHKHHKIKINPIPSVDSKPNEEIILGVKPRTLEGVIPKCRPKSSSTCKSFVLKETKIRSNETINLCQPPGNESEPSSGEKTRQIEIPVLGTFNETVLPTQSKAHTPNVDLIAVQEDKYSALREIELELNQENNSGSKEVNDDFGDFLSAAIPLPDAPEPTSTAAETFDSSSVIVKLDEKEDWGDWNFSTETSQHSTTDTQSINTDVIGGATVKVKNDVIDSFTSLTLNDKPNRSLSDFVPVQNFFWEEPKNDNLNNVIVFDGNAEKPEGLQKADQTFNIQSDNEFWEFLTTDVKTPAEGSFSRHDSLPSLDLKISPTEENEQETIWRKCLDSCHVLIQEGYEIFNSINRKSVLDEVFGSSKTEDYLNYLNIAFQISRRVSKNFSSIPSIQEDLEKLWGRLQDLCFEYNIKLKHDEDNCSEGKVRCNICLRRIGFDLISQGAGSYHPTCANLWINFVESTLPFSI